MKNNSKTDTSTCPTNGGIRVSSMLILLFVALFASVPAFSQAYLSSDPLPAVYKSTQADIFLFDSLVEEDYDTITKQWVFYNREVYSYDASGHALQFTDYDWDTIADRWLYTEKDQHSFDADGDKYQSEHFQWDISGTHWDTLSKVEYSYDTQANLHLETGYSWDTITHQWSFPWKSEYTYDTIGKCLQEANYYWRQTGLQWIPGNKQEYTYDPEGYLTQEISYQWINNSLTWMPGQKISYAYDENKNKIQQKYDYWDEVQWVDDNVSDYTFDTNGRDILCINSVYDAGSDKWSNSQKWERGYDEKGYESWVINFKWDDVTSEWVARAKYEYIRDDSGYIELSLLYYWNRTTGQWYQARRSAYYYSRQTTSLFSGSENSAITVYPNPANDFITIELDDPLAVIELYDMQGRKMLSQRMNGNNQVAVSHLKNGIYLYRIFSNEMFSGKIVIRRE